MKIEIEDDLFDIVERIKDIDDGYFVLYDDIKNVYEIHNKCQENTYCITCPYECLDNRVIDLLLSSSICNIDKIIEEIDKNNNNIEKYANDWYKDKSEYMLSEIYKFANNSSKKFDENLAFNNVWR